MAVMDLSERDICTKFITPALVTAGWDVQSQIREEVSFTKGRIIVRGKLVTRGRAKRADYILYYKPNIPLALIEAKDGSNAIGAGMQQALEYAATLDIPFVFASNGSGFVFHDRAGVHLLAQGRNPGRLPRPLQGGESPLRRRRGGLPTAPLAGRSATTITRSQTGSTTRRISTATSSSTSARSASPAAWLMR